MENINQSINELIAKAQSAGFEVYDSFNEGEHQHEILTCLKGEHDGEVIDIYYNFKDGAVSDIQHSCQFKNQTPTFKF